jgi:hypothetical protein
VAGAELAHKVGHTVVPAVLVLVGGFTLRWIMVNAGQMSEIVPVADLGMDSVEVVCGCGPAPTLKGCARHP